MKSLIAFVFCLLPLAGFCQDLDSVRVAGEVDSLIGVCRGLFGQGEIEEALHKIEEAKQICRAVLGEESEKYANCLLTQVRIVNSIGETDESESLVLQAKAIKGKIWGTNHPNYAAVINVLGIVYHTAGEYEKAINQYLEAKSILEQSVNKEHPDYAKTLNNLALLYQETGEYKKSLDMNFKAKDIREKTFGKESPDFAQSLNNIGLIYRDIGNYDLALSNLLESKSIIEKTMGRENFEYTRTVRNLGTIYLNKGDFDNAYLSDSEAITVSESIFGKEHPEYIKSLNNQIDYFRQRGDLDKAMTIATEVKYLAGNVYGLDHPEYALALNNLGNCYQEKNDTEKSLQLFLSSLEITEKVYGKMSQPYAIILMNLGGIYDSKGDAQKAEIMHLQSLEIIEKILGKNNVYYPLGLSNLVNIYRKIGKYDKALQLQKEALTILENVFGKEHPDYAATQELLAILYSEIGDIKSATTSFISSNTATKSLLARSAAYSTELEMLHYKATLEERFDDLTQFVQHHPTDSLICATFDNALFLNNTQLFNAIAREKGIAQADNNTRAIHAEWKSCHFQLGKLYSQPIAERDPASIAQLEEQTNSYEKELVRNYPNFAETRREVGWEDLKAKLDQREAAIEFVKYRCLNLGEVKDSTMYAALVLLPNSTAPAFVPLCQESDLLAILDQPQGYKQGYFDRLYRGIKPRANAKTEGLYQLLWQPLDSLLQGTKRIYFAPSGLLHRINLAAIPNPAEQKTIGSKYQLVQLGSTRQLVVKNETVFTMKDAIVLGGINYEAENTVPLLIDTAVVEDALAFGSSPDFNGLTRNLRGGEWNYLEGTAKEATDIAKLLKKKGFQAKTVGGHAASEEAFKIIGQGGKSPRVLHIATHGFFFPDPKTVDGGRQSVDGGQAIFKQSDNPMIRSGLILAGANPVWKGEPTPAGKEDGILTAYEISQMNLSNTELVVLSACETGLGDIQGNEGVYGLQRAFKIAGAKHLIMSLWDVPDAETAEFMAHFYKEWLGGKDINAAFRHTQQAMQEAYPNEPFLWAGFVLVE